MKKYKTAYEVYSSTEYGFGGDRKMTILVTEETKNKIVGDRLFWYDEGPEGEVTVIKSNVQGWYEKPHILEEEL